VTLSPEDLDALARRANTAGFQSIAAYAEALEVERLRLRPALELIAESPDSGRWGRVALAALDRLDGARR
jgi:hypothetical protein